MERDLMVLARRTAVTMLSTVLVLGPGSPVCLAGRQDQGRGPSPHPKLSRALSEKARGEGAERVDVIVAFVSRPAEGEPSLASQMDGEKKQGYKRLSFEAMQVPARALEALANHPNVKFVSADEAVTSHSVAARETARVPGSSTVSSTTNTTYDGNGVAVAVLDSGVYSHGDYDATLLAQFDFVGAAAGVETGFSDTFGHGTHVAGMIGADGHYSTSEKYRGAAADGGIVSLRVLNELGVGSVSDVLQALDWILTTGKTTYGIRVANLSLGKGVDTALASDPLVQAVDAVWDAGVVVVVSAGNFGWTGHYTITSPGISRKVITVGSLTDNDTGSNFADDYVSTYSSRGPTLYDHVLKPDLVAPGNRVIATFAEISTLGTLLPGNILCGSNGSSNCNQRYLRLSGSSMATAVVSGAVARMLDKDGTLSPSTVKARLMKSARKIAGDPTVTGAGVLDVNAAMNLTGTLKSQTQALSPLIALSSDSTRVYVEDTSKLWGSSQWAAGYIWTNGSLWSNGYTSASGYVWSDASLWSNEYLWSNGSIWSNGFIWSNGSIWSNGFIWSNYVQPFSLGTEDSVTGTGN
jgi:serine protease AprX